MIPKKRKRERLGVRGEAQWRSPRHLKHTRSHYCMCAEVPGHVCEGVIEAMHKRNGTDCGIGVKPSDFWSAPGCSGTHRRQHQIGEAAWEKENGVDFGMVCEVMNKTSPCRQEIEEWKREHG